MSLCLAGVVTRVSSVVVSYCVYYMATDHSPARFLYVLLTFVVRMLLLVFSSSPLLVLTGWDGLGIRSYFLVCYYPTSSAKISGLITVATNRFGDVFIIYMACVLLLQGRLQLFDTPSS